MGSRRNATPCCGPRSGSGLRRGLVNGDEHGNDDSYDNYDEVQNSGISGRATCRPIFSDSPEREEE